MSRLLAAIRSQPWAIMPEYLAAIEAIALRFEGGEALGKIAADGHAERYAQFEAALATGERVPGTRTAVMAADGVAMLPMIGPIMPRMTLMSEISGGLSAEALQADLAAVEASKDVKRALLVVDCPGGAVTGIGRLAAQLAGMKTRVTAHVEGQAASAAYWVIAQAREISIDPTAGVGNIGVVMAGDHQEVPDADGNRRYEIVSSNAPAKRPDLSSEDGQAMVRAVCDAIEAEFISAVATGRGVTEATVRSDFASVFMRIGADAKAKKMADRVEYRAAALERLAMEVAGSKPKRSYAEASQTVAQLRAGFPN